MREHVAVLLLVVAGGCGGGGAGGEGSGQQVQVSFGTVAADAPTVREVVLRNPVTGPATVEPVSATGPFRAVAGQLPASAPSGAPFALEIQFDPPAPGVHVGAVTVRFVPAGGGAPADVTVAFRATAEAAMPRISAGALDFGDVRMTMSAIRKVTLFNEAALTSFRVASPILPGGFAFVGTTFPIHVLPGQTRVLDLEYSPIATGTNAFDIIFPHNAGVVVLKVPVVATTSSWPEEMIVEYGDVPVDANGDTEWLEVEIPPYAISVTFEASGTVGEVVECTGIEWPGGHAPPMPPFGLPWTYAEAGVRSVTIPWTDASTDQLAPDGGTYRFRFRLESGVSPALSIRALIESRPWGVVSGGVLDLNVFVAPSLQPAPGQVPSQLSSFLTDTDSVLSAAGLKIGDVAVYTDLSTSVISDPWTLYDVLQESAKAVAPRMNVFLLYDFIGPGTSPAVQGPAANGWPTSGVVVEGFAGGTAAHEIGHFLGLHHTAADAITDTDASSANNFMRPSGGTTATAGQAHVILRHPLVRSP